MVIDLGITGDTRQRVKDYLYIRQLALATEAMYRRVGVLLPKGCDLYRCVQAGKTLWEKWLIPGRAREPDLLRLAMNCERLASVALYLMGEAHAGSYLRRLTRGGLDAFQQKHSSARNAELEIAVWAHLRAAGVCPEFAEPDVVVTVGTTRVALACKRLYSESNANKTFSRGVEQVKRSGLPGLLVLDVSSLIYGGRVIRAPSARGAWEALDRIVQNWLASHSHSRRLSEYMKHGRLLGIIVWAEALAEIRKGASDTLFWIHDIHVWTRPDMDPSGKRCVRLITRSLQDGNPEPLTLPTVADLLS